MARTKGASARPVDILYLGILTAEHFPLQLELPDTGATWRQCSWGLKDHDMGQGVDDQANVVSGFWSSQN